MTYTIEQTKKIVGEDNWKEFLKWMEGQTVEIGKDGKIKYFEYDVDRFAKGERVVYD